jgi:hypothetical protein
MPRPTLSSYLREHLDGGHKKKESGPYLTISCQHGCDGYDLGLTLAEMLNKRDELQRWKVYYKEFIQQLSDDTGVPEELLERERVSKPSMFKDFFRGLNRKPIPDRTEIRNQTGQMIRIVAINGYGIIIGQGGASATSDIGNGLTLRIEAPRDWRIARICRLESLDRHAATAKIEQFDEEQTRLRAYYNQKNKRQPEFHLVFDNSLFTKEIIAELVVKAMEEKGMIEKPS